MSKNRKVKRPARSKGAARRSKVRPPAPRAEGRGREITGIVGLGVAIFLIAALLSLQIGSGSLMGPFGLAIASLVYGIGGLCSYFLAAALGVVSVRLLLDRPKIVRLPEALGIVLALASLTTLLHLIGAGYRVAGYGPGGFLGEDLAETFRGILSTAGTVLLALMGLVCAAVVATPLRMRQVFGLLRRVGLAVWQLVAQTGLAVARFCGEVVRAILPERDHDEYLDDDYEYEDEDYDAYDLEAHGDPAIVDPPIIEAGSGAVAAPIDDGDTERVEEEQLAAKLDTLAEAKRSKKPRKSAAAVIVEQPAAAAEPTASEPAMKAAEGGERAPLIVESKFKHAPAKELAEKEKAIEAERLDFIPLSAGKYQLPPLNLLEYSDEQASDLDREAMLELSAKLTQTLENYGVKGEVMAIRPGPVVTMYEFAPAPGTRLNKIVNLNDDLAMALEALCVRIVAPIPGKAAVGIEVPNKTRETVYLKEILADDVFAKRKHKLPLALGKDIEGAPEVVDLAKMPHLLVAGTTGSGKSVSVNAMITSLLYSASPEEVRMIMVDPKMLELSIYEGVPHLLLPVVTDPKKANLALRWAVEEMDSRYDLLARMGVRDIATYNKKAEKLRAQYEADALRRAAEAAQRAANEDEVEVTEEREGERAEEPPRSLPYIVVIIDEFADLMMCAPKEVETSVARIAQKARAAGIHLILATQRPSVDVITGLIKANFPSRTAFRVTSKVDSRTILDQGGAEALLGSGDMLFSDRGASPRRLHGCYVDEDEIHRVVEFLKTQGRPVYNLDIIKPRDDEDDAGSTPSSGSDVDEMYDRAVAIVAETGTCSISMIQRRLRIGYNRAARIVEAMEGQGIVGSPDHTNRREVLITPAA